jgi:hypothetical protein
MPIMLSYTRRHAKDEAGYLMDQVKISDSTNLNSKYNFKMGTSCSGD